jgi:8-oxo-dGTP pyrophosphatase MutT (NUDIX family)
MRETIVELLRAHVAVDDQEEADRCAMLQLAHELEDPISRDQERAHFTASAIVVDAGGARTLLVHHVKSGNWLQPGGHIDATDATPADAALREVREETGLDGGLHPAGLISVDAHWIPWDGHHHLDLRFLAVASGEPTPQAEEVHEVRWFAWDEALALAGRERALVRAFAQARALTS